MSATTGRQYPSQIASSWSSPGLCDLVRTADGASTQTHAPTPSRLAVFPLLCALGSVRALQPWHCLGSVLPPLGASTSYLRGVDAVRAMPRHNARHTRSFD